MSPQSQNEFVTLLGEEIQETISKKVMRSGYCFVMAGTTPDVSHMDELSVAVRFVDPDSLKPDERLVCIKETCDKTGKGQAKDIVHCLKSADIRHVVKHGLDSLVKHGLDPISKTWTRLVKHGLE